MEGYLIILKDAERKIHFPVVRYFKFVDGTLVYYASRTTKDRLGQVDLTGHKVAIRKVHDQEDPTVASFPSQFRIDTQPASCGRGGRSHRGALSMKLLLSASSDEVKDEWCRALKGWRRRFWAESYVISGHGMLESMVLLKMTRRCWRGPLTEAVENTRQIKSNHMLGEPKESERRPQDVCEMVKGVLGVSTPSSNRACGPSSVASSLDSFTSGEDGLSCASSHESDTFQECMSIATPATSMEEGSSDTCCVETVSPEMSAIPTSKKHQPVTYREQEPLSSSGRRSSSNSAPPVA